MEHIHGLKNELRIKDLIVNYIAHRKKKSGTILPYVLFTINK